jgi:hypothetical protein
MPGSFPIPFWKRSRIDLGSPGQIVKDRIIILQIMHVLLGYLVLSLKSTIKCAAELGSESEV